MCDLQPPSPPSSAITLRVTSRPADAMVFLDGVRVGRAPVHVTVAPASRTATLKLRRIGYRAESVEVALDRDADLHIALQPGSSDP